MIEVIVKINRTDDEHIRIQVSGLSYGAIEPEIGAIAEDFLDTLEELAAKHCPTLCCVRRKAE